jgi:hypothetical protein
MRRVDVLTRLAASPGDAITTTRRRFLRTTLAAGGATMLATTGAIPALAKDDDDKNLKEDDREILIAAEIAEALAVTTYSNIIDVAPFFTHLADDDQGYLKAAR